MSHDRRFCKGDYAPITFIHPTPPSAFGGRSRLAKTEAFCLHCLRRHLCVSCKSISLPPKSSSTPSHLLGALFLLLIVQSSCRYYCDYTSLVYFLCLVRNSRLDTVTMSQDTGLFSIKRPREVGAHFLCRILYPSDMSAVGASC
jgi:hypothetical protein